MQRGTLKGDRLWPCRPRFTPTWRGWTASGADWKRLGNGTCQSIIFKDRVSVTVACSASYPKARCREICVLIWDSERLGVSPLTVWGEETIFRAKNTARPSSAAAAGFFRFKGVRLESKLNDDDLSVCKWDPSFLSSCVFLIPGFMARLQCSWIDTVWVVSQDTVHTHTHPHTHTA